MSSSSARRSPSLLSLAIANRSARISCCAQVVQKFTGYRIRRWARAAYILLVCFTGGAAWLVAYTFPRTTLWTLKVCQLHQADHVLAKVLPKAQSALCCVVIFCLWSACIFTMQAMCSFCYFCLCTCKSKNLCKSKSHGHDKDLVLQLFNGQQQLVKVYEIPKCTRVTLVSCLHHT